MASRTKQKEEARARRIAEERERAERARRQRRLRTIGGTVLIAIAVVVVGIAVSSGGGTTATGLQKGAKATSTVNTVDSLLNGVSQSGNVLGNPKAPVTMTYYGDLECPICQAFTLQGGFPQLVTNDVRAGRVKVVYSPFQTATGNAGVFKSQQVAALAAGMQHKFWNYAELFYREQGQEGSGYVTESYLDNLAKQVTGLNLSTWEADRNNASLVNQVVSDENSGNKIGVSGTPTLVFTGPKGSTAITSGIPAYSELQQAISKVA